MKRRSYAPTETDLALNPKRLIFKCSCGVSFADRGERNSDEDDPEKCLTCNRKAWSKLWEKPAEEKVETESLPADVVPIRKR